jgi:hypothetical protein
MDPSPCYPNPLSFNSKRIAWGNLLVRETSTLIILAPSQLTGGWRLGVLYPGSSCMPGGQIIPCNNTNPGPGTPTHVLQQFDSDLIVINEAGHPFPFSSLGLSEMFRHHHIGEENVRSCCFCTSNGMVIFLLQMQPTFFYVTDSFEEDFVSLNEVTYFTDPEAYLWNSVDQYAHSRHLRNDGYGETECMAMLIRSLGQNTSVLCISYRTTLTEQLCMRLGLDFRKQMGTRQSLGVTLNSLYGSQLESSTW